MMNELLVTSTMRARNTSTVCMIWVRVSGVALTLIIARSRLTVGCVGQIVHLDHVDQLVQVGGQSLDAQVVAVHHDRHARDAWLFGVTDGQGFDIERPAAKQRRYPVQHAGFVFYKGY